MKPSKILLNAVFIILIAIGFNLDIIFPGIAKYSFFMTMFFSAIWLVIIFTDKENFDYENFRVGWGLLKIVFPIIVFLFQIVSHSSNSRNKTAKNHDIRNNSTQNQVKDYQSASFKLSADDCSKIKYGQFRNMDVKITRISINNEDFEIRNAKDTFKVEWTGDCSYTVHKNNNKFEMNRITEIADGLVFINQMNHKAQRSKVVYDIIYE